MRVEIVQELDAGDPQLEVPWASKHNPTIHYVDLKQFPEEIDLLRECRRHPPLARLLRQLNTKASPFRTAKCDVWVTTRLAEDERLDFPVRFKVGSYIDLLFDSTRTNASLKAYQRLGKRLEDQLRHCRLPAQAEAAIRRCLFHPKERWGFYTTLFVHAYGATRVESLDEWCRAIEALGRALTRISRSFRKAGKKA